MNHTVVSSERFAFVLLTEIVVIGLINCWRLGKIFEQKFSHIMHLPTGKSLCISKFQEKELFNFHKLYMLSEK